MSVDPLVDPTGTGKAFNPEETPSPSKLTRQTPSLSRMQTLQELAKGGADGKKDPTQRRLFDSTLESMGGKTYWSSGIYKGLEDICKCLGNLCSSIWSFLMGLLPGKNTSTEETGKAEAEAENLVE